MKLRDKDSNLEYHIRRVCALRPVLRSVGLAGQTAWSSCLSYYLIRVGSAAFADNAVTSDAMSRISALS